MNFSCANFLPKREKCESFEWWVNELPEDWVKYFIDLGLRPFLKKHGYVIHYGDKIYKQILYWAWSHAFVTNNKDYIVRHRPQLHLGGHDEYDWFCYMIPFELWDDFMDEWSELEWLDDSDVGVRQRADLQSFIWNIIDLANSPSHHRWNEMTEYQNEDSDKENNKKEHDVELHAFAGDRRTH
jgi:hypothetical protein